MKNKYANCLDCPFSSVIRDPDPHDWFCDDDAAVVCTKTPNPEMNPGSKYLSDQSEHRSVSRSVRPYNLRKESATPSWCPLTEKN